MTSVDVRYWSRDFFREFVDLYRSFPCLWQIKSKEYRDRNKKAKAYAASIKKCREVEPQANKDFVAKKINSFRTVYRKECVKIKSSLESGASSDNVYKPSLWYFDLLYFLNDADQEPRQSFSSLDNENYEEEDEADLIQLDDVEVETILSGPATPLDESSVNTVDTATSSNFTPATGRPSGKKRKNRSPTTELLTLAGEQLKAINSDDEFQLFGKYVAHKLRGLKGNQQIFARKLISDVIYEGELESLTKDYKLVNCASGTSANSYHGGFPQSYPSQQPPSASPPV